MEQKRKYNTKSEDFIPEEKPEVEEVKPIVEAPKQKKIEYTVLSVIRGRAFLSYRVDGVLYGRNIQLEGKNKDLKAGDKVTL